jgi:hypothetical protein
MPVFPCRCQPYPASARRITKCIVEEVLNDLRDPDRIGIDDDRLLAESFRRWKRTLSQERDRRAGPAANAQKRGRVSRELAAELEKALSNGDD